MIFRLSVCEGIVGEQSSQIHQFGDITVDPAGMRVRRGSDAVALEPKSLKVLLYLIENRDRLVTKEEQHRCLPEAAITTPGRQRCAKAEVACSTGGTTVLHTS